MNFIQQEENLSSVFKFNLPNFTKWQNLIDGISIQEKLIDISHCVQDENLFKVNDKKLKHEMTQIFVHQSSCGEGISTTQEKQNIFKTWQKIQNILANEEKMNHGLLETQLIKDLHYCLMKDVINPDIYTPAGQFSLAPRDCIYKGKTHEYPQFENEKDWYNVIQGKIDWYNSNLELIKSDLHSISNLEKLFKLISWIFIKLIELHPFSDGNGRCCRILAAYILTLICPFPCPIYNNIFDLKDNNENYIDSIILGENGKLESFCCLIIESVWYSWKFYQNLCSDIPSLKQ